MAPPGVCPFTVTRKLVHHTILTLCLVFVEGAQGVLLNIFLIKGYPNEILPYFCFIADLLIVLLFGLTMYNSYSYWKKVNGKKIRIKSKTKLTEQIRRPSLFVRYKNLLGLHPLSYATWFSYSLVLVIKVAVIFKLNIVNSLPSDSFFGPQVMKFSLGLTAFVFFIFVESHYDAARNSLQAVYIGTLIKGNVLEVLDSITFLSLLFVSETRMMFTYNYENVIIAFACINLLLPNICLYKLSQSDYGRITTSAVLSFTYKMLHLLLVNIPYMAVRIYLWSTMGTDVSVFLIKNVVHIVMTLMDAKSDFLILRAACPNKQQRMDMSTVSKDTSPGRETETQTETESDGDAAYITALDKETSGDDVVKLDRSNSIGTKEQQHKENLV